MHDELNQEYLRKTAVSLAIPVDFIRKDYFVTRAIKTLTTVNDDYYTLFFQGGTSLSKGYQLVQRLSEDVDFRVVPREKTRLLGKDAHRKRLRDFRYALVVSLIQAGFTVAKNDIEVFL